MVLPILEWYCAFPVSCGWVQVVLAHNCIWRWLSLKSHQPKARHLNPLNEQTALVSVQNLRFFQPQAFTRETYWTVRNGTCSLICPECSGLHRIPQRKGSRLAGTSGAWRGFHPLAVKPLKEGSEKILWRQAHTYMLG